MQIVQQSIDHIAGLGVQVAGRLVGKQEGGVAHQRPGQHHALLLAAGEFSRPVRGARAQADLFQPRHRGPGRLGAGDAPDQQRHHDVLERGELRQQVMDLPHEPDRPVAQVRQLGVRQRRDVLRPEIDSALRRPVQPAEQVQERGLAGARLSHDGQPLAPPHFEIETGKHHQLIVAGAVPLGDIGGPDGDVIRRFHAARPSTLLR